MRKFLQLSACVVMAAAGAAHAQSDGVKFYGLIDGGYASTSISGSGNSTGTTNFITGGYIPTFVGMTATRDLGEGYTGGIGLEQGFLLSENNSSESSSHFAFATERSLFNRGANLFLTGSFGNLTAGTQTNVVFKKVVAFDPRGASNYGTANPSMVILGGLHTTDAGALTYTSPKLANFTAQVSYLPETATIRTGNRGTVTYEVGDFKAMVASYRTDMVAEANNRSGTLAGASYKLGAAELKALYATQKSSGIVALNRLDTLGLGGNYAISPRLSVDAGAYNVKDSEVNAKADIYAIGAKFGLAPGLMAYAQYASTKNTGSTIMFYNMVGNSTASSTITAGQTANVINLGLYYAF